MSRRTSELRKLWAPACKRAMQTVTLHSGARITIAKECVEAFKAIDSIMQSFKYAPRRKDTGAFNCRKITGGSNYSLHAYGIAVDYNWSTNPYGRKLITDMPRAMVAAIKGIKTKKGVQVFRWGGDYSKNKDAMHYEVVASPAELKAGIDWSTVPAEPPNPNDPSSHATLQKGDKGPTVEKLHDLLVKAGYKELDGKGNFGAKTDVAVRDYQSGRGLGADGVCGLQTWTALINDYPKLKKGEPSPVKADTRTIADRPTVKRGSSGGAVEELQRRLAEKGFDPGPADGKFGAGTQSAVKAFQKAHGLKADGIVGSKTWTELVAG